MTEGLGIQEMDVVLREMSEQELLEVMQDLQDKYKEKRIKLGHCTTQEQETAMRDDMLMDNLYYMKAMKHLKDLYQRKASEYWRKFDHEAEEYMRKLIENLNSTRDK